MTDLTLTAPFDYQIAEGDCLAVMRQMPDACVDAIVTDPPYGLRFMGKKWDYDVPTVEVWQECLRVLKPGGHLLAFAGTRTQHRMACRIEDGGFEIRDMIAWVYGSGFPKSLDVSKAIDGALGAERKVVGPKVYVDGHVQNSTKLSPPIGTFQRTQDERIETAPATDAARQWQGWGTALKPALEPITVARKPFKGTVASNVLEHGTGAINVDGCRVGMEEITTLARCDKRHEASNSLGTNWSGLIDTTPRIGRWPANLIHDGSEEVLECFPVTGASKASMRGDRSGVNTDFGGKDSMRGHNDNGGSAARFFYCPKASKADRDDGCQALECRTAAECLERKEGSAGANHPRAGAGHGGARNFHPTVKPTELMRYLCRLVTPPGGLVLDPFCGSGSTGRGAVLEGFRFLGLELDPDYAAIAQARIAAALRTAQAAAETQRPRQRRLL